MSRSILVIAILGLVLNGCLLAVDHPSPTASDQTISLPDTWTPAPTIIPSTTPTKAIPTQIPNIILSPSPTNPLPATLLPTNEIIPPSMTPKLLITPIPLVSGDKIIVTMIQMFTPTHGWAVGGQVDQIYRILVTDDGGYSWQDRTPPAEFVDSLYIVEHETQTYFWNQDIAWVLIDSEMPGGDPWIQRVWYTTNRGKTWASSEMLPFPLGVGSVTPGEFFFLNPLQGWLRTHSGITHMHDIAYLFQTDDGGQTWQLVNQPGNSMIETLLNSDMAFANRMEGWMTKDSLGGFTPRIELTRDGGLTWEQIDLPAPDGDWYVQDRRCIGHDPSFFADGDGIFLLNCYPFSEVLKTYDLNTAVSYLYRSPDLGVSWEIQPLPGSIHQLVFMNKDLGYAIGKEHFRTQDGGVNWEELKEVTWQGEFSFISDQQAWAVAKDGEELALVYTEDGGKRYVLIQPVVK